MKSILITFIMCVAFSSNAQKIDAEGKVVWNTERDSTYYTTYDKLKELFVQKIHSPSYKVVHDMTIAFKEKIRQDDGRMPEGLGQTSNILFWVKNNLPVTKFKSFNEAEEEWNAILKQYENVDLENPDYTRFSTTAIMKYGPLIFTDIVEEVMLEYPDKF